MKIDIVTLFPDMFNGPFQESILKRAQERNQVEIKLHQLRQWAPGPHASVDDRPYGGGPGMVMMIEPIDLCLKSLRTPSSKVILTSPRGTPFNQAKAVDLSTSSHLIILCGHYEGVDQRVSDTLVDEEISIGNYVLTGGEIPAMVMVDAVVRLLPGVLGDPESINEESHQEPGLLEYPHYTRPDNYHGLKVPEVLLSGDHARIKDWRLSQRQR